MSINSLTESKNDIHKYIENLKVGMAVGGKTKHIVCLISECFDVINQYLYLLAHTLQKKTSAEQKHRTQMSTFKYQ